MKLEEHPTVKWFRQHAASRAPAGGKLEAAWLRQLCLDCGADDAGLVEISRPALDDQRDDILRYFPPARTLLSFVCRMNRQPIRSPARSVANLEFHHAGDHVNEVARKVVAALEGHGVSNALTGRGPRPTSSGPSCVGLGHFRTLADLQRSVRAIIFKRPSCVGLDTICLCGPGWSNGQPGLFQRASGFEPPTSSLGSWHSTTELRPHACHFTWAIADCKFNERSGPVWPESRRGKGHPG